MNMMYLNVIFNEIQYHACGPVCNPSNLSGNRVFIHDHIRRSEYLGCVMRSSN